MTMAARFHGTVGTRGLAGVLSTSHRFRALRRRPDHRRLEHLRILWHSVNWKSEKVASRYVGGAKTTRNPTGTSPDTAKAHNGAANTLDGYLDPAVGVLFPPRSTPPPGLPIGDCMRCFSSAFSTEITTQRA